MKSQQEERKEEHRRSSEGNNRRRKRGGPANVLNSTTSAQRERNKCRDRATAKSVNIMRLSNSGEASES